MTGNNQSRARRVACIQEIVLAFELIGAVRYREGRGMQANRLVGLITVWAVGVATCGTLWSQELPTTANDDDTGVYHVSDSDSTAAATPDPTGTPVGYYLAGDCPTCSPGSSGSFAACDQCDFCDECDEWDDDDGGSCCKFFGTPDPSRRGLFAGGSYLSFELQNDNDTAFIIRDTSGVNEVAVDKDFAYEQKAGARAWAGYMTDTGFAAVVTYLYFSDDDETGSVAGKDFVFFNGPVTPTVFGGGGLLVGGVNGDYVQAKQNFTLYTIDGELTKEINKDHYQTTFGGGFRHGGVHQRYKASGTANGVLASSKYSNRFDGNGPTLFSEVRIPILGSKDRRFIGSAGLSMVGSVRGSFLYGDTKYSATDVNAGVPDTVEMRTNDTISVIDAMLGIQADIRPIDGHLVFVRAAWEVQHWHGMSNQSSPENDFGLAGFSLTGGLNF